MPTKSTQTNTQELERLQRENRELAEQIERMRELNARAGQDIGDLEKQQREIIALNERMAKVNAEGAELMASLEEKNAALAKLNRDLAKANAHSAELTATLEEQREELEQANAELAKANAHSAELVVEVEAQREQLAAKNERLHEINNEKSRLLGMVAHDIRNGISIIGMQVDLIKMQSEQGKAPDESSVDIVKRHCKSLTMLLNDALDISKIEEGKMEPKLADGRLDEVIREVAALYALPAERKEQELEVAIDGELPVRMDRGMMLQVMNNLISNAVKYTPKGGRVRVHAWKGKTGCEVRVSDTGPGLTDKDQQEIFGSFCKLSAKPTGGEKSHGLGLAICKKLIALHGGELHADNNADGGATFFFTLPSL